MTKTTKNKRPPPAAAKVTVAKATVAKALKQLSLKDRVEVVASVFGSMGLPFLASILREANS